MKPSRLLLFVVASTMMFLTEGCVDPRSLVTVGVDRSLPVIRQVNVLVEKSSVGFEWPAIKDPRAKGINVYRATASAGKKQQKFYKIATIDDRYATHFVDRSVKPNTRYLYTFTTYDLLHESPHGKIVRVQTPSAYSAVEFVKVYLRDPGVVKVLWKPHPNPRIAGYVIQRRPAGGESKWRHLATVPGRLMPEYIDSSPVRGYRYSYRVIARSSDGVLSMPSAPATIMVK
jgi:fibronectin type 3 domain-containing protein